MNNSHLYGLGMDCLHFYLGSDSFGDSVHCIKKCNRRSFWEMVIYCLASPGLGEGVLETIFSVKSI